MADKVELCAQPQAIYNAYKRILPKKKDELLTQEEGKTDNTNKALDGMLNFDDKEE